MNEPRHAPPRGAPAGGFVRGDRRGTRGVVQQQSRKKCRAPDITATRGIDAGASAHHCRRQQLRSSSFESDPVLARRGDVRDLQMRRGKVECPSRAEGDHGTEHALAKGLCRERFGAGREHRHLLLVHLHEVEAAVPLLERGIAAGARACRWTAAPTASCAGRRRSGREMPRAFAWLPRDRAPSRSRSSRRVRRDRSRSAGARAPATPTRACGRSEAQCDARRYSIAAPIGCSAAARSPAACRARCFAASRAAPCPARNIFAHLQNRHDLPRVGKRGCERAQGVRDTAPALHALTRGRPPVDDIPNERTYHAESAFTRH